MYLPSMAGEVATPCYLIGEGLLRRNLEILRRVMDETGCKILLAQKAFSMYYFYPLIGQYLSGFTASGLYEARLAYETICKTKMTGISGVEKTCENHVFSPAYTDQDMEELLKICDHIVFNSFAQWEKYKDRALEAGVVCGLRINPAFSTQEHAIYNPCAAGSRLGVTLENFQPERLSGLSGLHFHCLCEQDADALEQTFEVVAEKFGSYLHHMEWINFGGGHHITREGYDMDRLIALIKRVQQQYQVQVYLEPGEAVALNAGFLVTKVLDFVENGAVVNAILDTSAACHMPDVLEMPYHPPLYGSAAAGEKAYTYRLCGPTCLAGDIIGDYSFEKPLQIGSRLVFGDMAIYSMVKNNTFNGMPLPDIVAFANNGIWEVVKHFDYQDFKRRL